MQYIKKYLIVLDYRCDNKLEIDFYYDLRDKEISQKKNLIDCWRRIPSCPLTTTISPLLATMAAEGTITLSKLFH